MEKFDALEWAKCVKPRLTHKCQTCQMKEVTEATRSILKMQLEGKVRHVSLAMMWGKWKEEYNYPYAYTTFKGHVTKCEDNLWRVIRGETPKASKTAKEAVKEVKEVKEATRGTSSRR